jgi:hypothetical protein
VVDGPCDFSVHTGQGLIQGACHGDLFRFRENDSDATVLR